MRVPGAVWSALFFVAVFAAEWGFGRGTVQRVFEQAGVMAAAASTVIAWALKAYEEYRRVQTGMDVVHTMGRGVDDEESWLSRFLFG